ncbi:head-tail adaptor [Vibrio phage D51]
MSIITLEEFKVYASISSPNQDDRINALLEPATEMIEGYLKQTFTSEDLDTPVTASKTETFLTRPFEQEYLLDEVDTTIANVSLAGIRGNEAPELTADDWFPDTRLGKVTLFYPMTDTIFKITVEYDVTRSPTESIKLAACMLVDYWLQKDFNSAVAQGGQSVTYVPVRTLPKHIENILNNYRTM